MEKSYYTVTEVADTLGYNCSTIRRWINEGKINLVEKSLGGQYRIPTEEFCRIQKLIKGDSREQ